MTKCSFCSRHEKQVVHIISAKSGGPHICDRCVLKFLEMMNGRMKQLKEHNQHLRNRLQRDENGIDKIDRLEETIKQFQDRFDSTTDEQWKTSMSQEISRLNTKVSELSRKQKNNQLDKKESKTKCQN